MILRRPRSGRASTQAARALAAGELVAFPTETVYGLGATRRRRRGGGAASSPPRAGRSDHPLIVHVADAGAVPALRRATSRRSRSG